MRFGLALPHYDTSFENLPVSWENVKRVALTAEAAGFDSVWVSDHLFLDWGKYGGPPDAQGALECWTTLGALAAATERVRIGSLTVCNDLRNPGLLAKMAATVDQLSDGRLDLGLGAGWYEPEYAAAGIRFDPAGQRIKRLGEAAGLIGRLLEGGSVDHEGSNYSMTGAVCKPGPVQKPRPPIWIGGKGDYLLKTAARYADGWNFSWIGSLATYEERLGAAIRACASVGRDPETLRRSVGVYLMAGRDQGDLERRAARVQERTPPGVLTATSGERAVSWERLREGRLIGTTQEVIDQLGRLNELGVEEVILTLGVLPFQVTALEDVEYVGAEIASAL
jgi:probable F420-dependent oxidoreductase